MSCLSSFAYSLFFFCLLDSAKASSFFFFSSRRRHTRSKRDWSSDVCSSDLGTPRQCAHPARTQRGTHGPRSRRGWRPGPSRTPLTPLFARFQNRTGPPTGGPVGHRAGHAPDKRKCVMTEATASGRNQPADGQRQPSHSPVARAAWLVGSTRGSADDAGAAPDRELVVAVRHDAVLVRPLRRQLGESSFDLAPDPPHGDPEDPLAALDEGDDLIRGRALVHTRTVAHQGDLGEVLDSALAQVRDGRPDLLERDAGIQEPLDHLEDEDVAEAVETLRP